MTAPTVSTLPELPIFPSGPGQPDQPREFFTKLLLFLTALQNWPGELSTLVTYLEGVCGGGGSGDMLAANNLSDVASVVTALANLGGAPDLIVPAVISDSSYVIQDTDRYAAKRLTNAAGCTVIVPLNATEAVPIGARARFAAEGAGGAVIEVEDAAVTLLSRGGALIAAEGSIFELHKVATDTWWVLGDVQES